MNSTEEEEFERLRKLAREIGLKAGDALMTMRDVDGAELVLSLVVDGERKKQTAQRAFKELENPSDDIGVFRQDVLMAKKAMEELDAKIGHGRVSGEKIKRQHGRIAALEDEVYELYRSHLSDADD